MLSLPRQQGHPGELKDVLLTPLKGYCIAARPSTASCPLDPVACHYNHALLCPVRTLRGLVCNKYTKLDVGVGSDFYNLWGARGEKYREGLNYMYKNFLDLAKCLSNGTGADLGTRQIMSQPER